ncbi:PREDICTED: tRNA:m(4)X modification enzyme TRM13 homolog [Drosophila arizonae]|uniref:tRNA:m(4)X modification enzyme TRM13 n=1 Tax=Drosophila arizonae TaxID=7263 RepID=A0ABM1NNP9_DROAR|nr:PREDICTED: tRNA:m(4)X modification enzyme TRM13 homolog [Drosophila arizonae]
MADAIPAKKPKMSPSEMPAQPVAANCAHWVQRKKRYCKMEPSKGSLFCGAHEPPSEGTAENADAERIPCPLDPKHTVFKRKLAKHLTICNARDQISNLPYIHKNINAGEELDSDNLQDICEYEKLKLHELEDEEFYRVIDKVKQLYDTHINGNIEQLQLQHSSLEEPLSHSEYGPETRKHLVQTSALLGILEQDQQLVDNTSFIEFGAGKGQLAFYLATALESKQLAKSQVVLVDRLSLRHKKDNKLTNKQLVQRIRADIADLKMSELPELQRTQRNVALSKHLCGAATDLTLRCVLADKEKCNTDYILIALCCHHRCSWRSYVGKKWLQTAGITPRDFVIITKMVSWAVCGTGISRERRKAMAEAATQEEPPQQEPTQRLSREQRELIGYQCKRVLDYGRLEHLRANGYQASLKFYVSRDVTLENVILLAKRDTPKVQ